MKKLFLILMILCVPFLTHAQQKANLTAASASCLSTNCVSESVDQTQGGATFTLTGTFSATVQFEASGDGGTTWVALNATPSNGTTAVTSATGAGVWQANVSGYTNIRERVSTYASGTAVATITESTASARAGGGGGGGGGGTAFPVTVTGGVSGGIPCFTSPTTENASVLLALNSILIGGGAGACPTGTTALPNGTTATMQAPGDASSLVATDSFVATATGGTATDINAVAFGVKANVNIATDATFVSTSQTVLIKQDSTGNEPTPSFKCPGAAYPCSTATPGCTTVAASLVSGCDINSIEYGTSMQFGNWNHNDAVKVPQGVITNIASAISATVSVAASGSCTTTAGNPICTYFWGLSDDTVAYNAAFVATTTPGVCGTLAMPTGFSFVSAAIQNPAVNACGSGAAGISNYGQGIKTGYSVGGKGVMTSGLVVLPTINASSNTCTLASANHACFFASSNDSGIYVHDFAIIAGYDDAIANISTDTMLYSGQDSITQRVALLDFAAPSVGFIMAGAAGAPAVVDDVFMECIGTNLNLDVNGGASYYSVVTNMITNSVFSCGYPNAQTQIAGDLSTTNVQFGDTLGAPAITLSAGKVWNSTNDEFAGTGIDSQANILNSGTFISSGDTISQSSNTSISFHNLSGGILKARNDTFVNVGSTPVAILNDSGGIIYDQCGNTILVGVFTNNGTFYPCANGNSLTSSGITSLLTAFCTSAASPAVCTTDPAGAVVVAAGATTVVVNTTAVTANSQIMLSYDSSLGSLLSVTCSATVFPPTVIARVPGTSFTISIASAPSVNPACMSYLISN